MLTAIKPKKENDSPLSAGAGGDVRIYGFCTIGYSTCIQFL